jgi:uncharacterized protein YndB with AHSA1/START domain
MADNTVPEGITTKVEKDSVSATGVVAAPPAEVFEYIRRPANHAEISGDGSVQGNRVGPDVLGAGDRFGMKMKMFGVPYPMTSKVTEFDDGRKIGWAHMVGHTWRWELEPTDDGGTKLTETFDLSTAKFPPMLRVGGYPKGHEGNVARSVANVRAHFA